MFIMSSALISVPMEMTAASFRWDSSSSSRGMPEKSWSAAFSLVPISLICRQPWLSKGDLIEMQLGGMCTVSSVLLGTRHNLRYHRVKFKLEHD